MILFKIRRTQKLRNPTNQQQIFMFQITTKIIPNNNLFLNKTQLKVKSVVLTLISYMRNYFRNTRSFPVLQQLFIRLTF